MKPTLLALTALASALALVSAAQAAPDHRTTSADQTALAVTIYNNDLALVKDARRVKLFGGENRLDWREVSARMQPETALLRSTDGHKLTLLEQNFDFDLLTPRKLLEKSVGEQVRVYRTQPVTGVEYVEQASILAANDGVVLRFADRVESGIPGRIAFSGVPSDLRDQPTLSMLFTSDAPLANPGAYQNSGSDHELELSYLTGGLTWKADYVAELSAQEDRIDLNGWVTLTNTSGTRYPNARLQLVAGEVNRAAPENMRQPMMVKAMAMAADAAPRMQEESLYEYHLYTLDRNTTLGDQQTKQVALLSAPKVAVAKEYRLNGGEWYYQGQYGELGKQMKPGVFMEFKNQGDSLGIPLPKGVVRVYKRDAAGRAQFIGEDRIDHTAKGETVKLKLGEAFDITADKKQTDFQKLAAGFNNRGGLYESGYQMEIRNAKHEDVVVTVTETVPGEWQIVQESLPHQQDSSSTVTWKVPVPAEGKTVLTWRVRVKY
jgi:hypothetical protein